MNELDDFEEIENSGRSDEELDLSNIYSIKTGGFGEGNNITTYLGTAEISNLIEDLSLYETLSKDKAWPVSQIIQREVDRIRVSEITQTYVLNESRNIKYFPPIIIAILPKTENGEIGLKLNRATENDNTVRDAIFYKSNLRANDKLRDYFRSAEDLCSLDGFYALRISKVFDSTLVCWDKTKYFAVIIDGQHRFASLVKSAKSDSTINNQKQDIVFLDCTNAVGKFEMTPVEVVRRIFVDINTNARKVNFVRQILMDDKDISSLCVQALVDSINKDGSSKDDGLFIRPQIVDWYGEKYKHELPHVTGILVLHQIINDFFIKTSLGKIEDFRNKRKVAAWVGTMNNLFSVDKRIQAKNIQDVESLSDSYDQYLQELEDNDEYSDELDDSVKETILFNFNYRCIDIAHESFCDIYLRSIILVFHEFLPFKHCIEIIDKKNGFGTSSVLAQALIASPKKIAGRKEYKSELRDIKHQIVQKTNNSFFLLFTVLGQKSLLKQYFTGLHQIVDPSINEDKCILYTQTFLKNFNKLFEYLLKQGDRSILFNKIEIPLANIDEELVDFGNLASVFWEGIIYDNNKIIYNTQGIATFSFILNEIKRKFHKPTHSIELRQAPYLKSRIKRILKRRYDYTESVADEWGMKVLNNKNIFINKILDNI